MLLLTDPSACDKYNKLNDAAIEFDTDKSSKFHDFTKVYSRYYNEIMSAKTILEIGVAKGGSVKMWAAVTDPAKTQIIGIDYNPMCKQFAQGNIDVLTCDQTDKITIDNYLSTKKLDILDIVIDDGHHTTATQLASFNILWPKVKSGGLYFIEDLHCNYLQNDQGFIYWLQSLIYNINREGKVNTGSLSKAIEMNPGLMSTFDSKLSGEVDFVHFYQGIVVIGKL